MTTDSYVPAGRGRSGDYDLEITPDTAGWGYSSLRILTLPPAGTHALHTEGEELLLLPLAGACSVEVDGAHLDLDGRVSVFAGPTDFAYLPVGHTATIHSERGGRFAVCGARTDTSLPLRYGAADQVPVELRGGGQASRQVRNFATPEAYEAGALIACEVITPGGNWSSYPAHKHDQASEAESELEEIYYFEIASGPHGEPGLGLMRVSSSPGHEIDVCEEVHDRDAILVPYGWHGPCVAAPGFDMYYLNVMAGPRRAWLISDHPEQTWVRGTWAAQGSDPRLTDRKAEEDG